MTSAPPLRSTPLTPLGDPPLFLGMLRGVPFTWTFGLFPMRLFVTILLLVTFIGLDGASTRWRTALRGFVLSTFRLSPDHR